MKTTVRRIGLVCFYISLFNSPSQAETESAATTSVRWSEARANGVFEPLSIEYSNVLAGPSLVNPVSNSHFDDESGSRTGSFELENALFVGLRLTADVAVGAVGKWNWHSASDVDQAFEVLDPYLRLSHGKLYSIGDLNFAADLRLSAPISKKSKTNGLVASVASEQGLTYEIPESRVSLGLTTFVQFNFHNDSGDHQEGDSLELHFSPGVAYKVSNSALLNVVYEATKTQARFADVGTAQPEGALIEAGVVWDITENLKFNPNIHTRTSRPFSAEAFTIGAKLNWVLL